MTSRKIEGNLSIKDYSVCFLSEIISRSCLGRVLLLINYYIQMFVLAVGVTVVVISDLD
jgi:hypothetical protein